MGDAVRTSRPDWPGLQELAAGLSGLFLASDAAERGFSTALLAKHVRSGRLAHVRRGIYRLPWFPAAENEDLLTAWLWSRRTGVFSHETALALHGLSDVLPARIHLTLPSSWRKRRPRPPDGVVLHFSDVPSDERTWVTVPVTTVRRTLGDCVSAHVQQEFITAAINQALDRGLVSTRELEDLGVAASEGRLST